MSTWARKTLVGHSFGRLTVVRLAPRANGQFRPLRHWVCKCACGNEVIVPTQRLTNGNTRSCGCLKQERIHPDLTGQTFNQLMVLEPAGLRRAASLWRCRCLCGGEAFVRTTDLRSGAVRSCGCLRPGGKHSLAPGKALRNLVISMYRGNAERKGLTFSLSVEEAETLFQSPCFYCGDLPSRTRTRRNRKGSYTYNGIDRLVNTEGYVPGNVVACCSCCNLTKGSMDHDTFVAWIRKVHAHIERRTHREGVSLL
jgi:hypothetical protein